MTDVHDALFTACNVEPDQRRSFYFPHSDQPFRGPLRIVPPLNVQNFTHRVRAFLSELDATLTVREVLDQLDEIGGPR